MLDDHDVIRSDRLRVPSSELVVGIVSGELARAYPVSVIRTSHIVNDQLGEVPVVVAFCDRCFSGVAFDPRVDGRRLTFDVFGAYQGAFAMRDRQTRSVWSSLSGEGLVGGLAGRHLEMIPAELTTLDAWLTRYPESSSPPVAHPSRRSVTPSLPRADARWWRSVERFDDRLPPGSLVIGVELEEQTRAYPIDRARSGRRVIQDELGGVPIVLLAEPGAFPLAYERRVGDRVLELTLDGGRIVDQDGWEWNGSGRSESVAAPVSLCFVRSQIVQWYAWAAHHPQTDVFELRPRPSPGPLA